MENAFFKVDLIWHLKPIRKVENARTLILFLSYFLQKLDFYDNKRTFTSCFWSQPQFFMKRHFFIWSHLGFISWRIYSLLRRVRHNSKIGSKNDILNQTCPNIYFHEKWLKITTLFEHLFQNYWPLLSTIEHYWPLFKTLLTTIEHYSKHYWALLNTIDHYWALFYPTKGFHDRFSNMGGRNL